MSTALSRLKNEILILIRPFPLTSFPIRPESQNIGRFMAGIRGASANDFPMAIHYQPNLATAGLIVLAVIAGLLAVSFPVAAADVTSDEPYGVGDLARDWWKDGIAVISEPPEWDRALLVLGVTAGLYHYDESIRDWAQTHRSEDSDRAADLFNPLGNGVASVPLLAGLYWYGKRHGDERAVTAGQLGLESMAISGALAQGLKYAAGRHRPNSGDPHDVWDGPGFSADKYQSFPSFHTTTAFAAATVIASVYEEDRFIPPLAYGAAALTGWSRLNDDAHWASDVFCGAVIGYTVAKRVLKRHSGQTAQTGFELVPIAGAHGGGIAVMVRF